MIKIKSKSKSKQAKSALGWGIQWRAHPWPKIINDPCDSYKSLTNFNV